MEDQERVIAFIDGSNHYHILKDIFGLSKTLMNFNFERFMKEIAGNRKLIRVYYYNASLKQQINPEIFKKQQFMFSRLRKWGFKVILCKRQKRDYEDGTTKHIIKGDDIYLAIDMLKGAYENEYDTAILFSWDGDFAKLVGYVSRKGKKVENYHFANTISFDLLKVCHKNITINKKILNKFFYRGEEKK